MRGMALADQRDAPRFLSAVPRGNDEDLIPGGMTGHGDRPGSVRKVVRADLFGLRRAEGAPPNERISSGQRAVVAMHGADRRKAPGVIVPGGVGAPPLGNARGS